MSKLKTIIVCLIIGLLISLSWTTPIGTYSNVFLLRTLFALRGEIPPPKDVVLIAIDDLSYEALELRANPQKTLADVITKIHLGDPSLLIIDLSIKPQLSSEHSLILAESIASGPTTIMLYKRNVQNLSKREKEKHNKVKFLNDPLVSKAATFEVDPRIGTLQDIMFKIRLEDPKNGSDEKQVPFLKPLRLTGFKVEKIPQKGDLINFYGPPNTITYHSMFEVMKNELDLNGKVVIMGYKSQIANAITPGIEDSHPTSGSFLSDYFGVEVQATILGNLIEGSFLKRLPLNVELVILINLFLIPYFLLRDNAPRKGLLCFIFFLFVWFLLTWLAFRWLNVVLPGAFLMIFLAPWQLAFAWYIYGMRLVEEKTKLQKS